MSNPLYYFRPGDNVARLATPTASAQDADYPATLIVDGDPTRPARLTTLQGNWVLQLAASVQIFGFAFFNHNLDASLDVYAEANTADSWGAPPVREQFTIGSADEAGFRPDPVIVLPAGTSSMGWARLSIEANNSAPPAVGQFAVFAAVRDFGQPLAGQRHPEIHFVKEDRTDGGIPLRTIIGTRMQLTQSSLRLTTAVANDIRSLQRACSGRAKAFVLVPDAAISDAHWALLSGETARAPLQDISPRHFDVPFEYERMPLGLTL